MNSILRWTGVVVAAGLLVVVCSHYDHGGAKGIAVPLPNIVSSITFAAIATLLTRRFFRTAAGKIAAPFVGGIAGAFGSLGQSYGPYGAVVGLLVGTIVVLVAPPRVGRLTNRST